MVNTDIHSPGAKVERVSSTKGMLKPSASTHMKEKPATNANCKQVRPTTSLSGTLRMSFSQRHICTAKSAALPNSKMSPKLLKAPCKALGPTKRAVPMVARATEPQVRWLMRRPSKRLKRGTSTMVRLPKRAPLEAVVYCNPTACNMKARKSHTASSAPHVKVQPLGPSAASAVSSPSLRRWAKATKNMARAAMPKRRDIHMKLSIAPEVASSVSRVLIST
mmetsp:Transcript_39164/g.64640  ORF Transcript_39164/g.64640 Transcript_39164/m.64640 type:complete len:221 (+) Transcript_39164:353-1015(+)